MNGFQLWKIHRAVKMHFTSDYDIFKYSGRFTRDNETTYNQVRRRKLYEILSNKFNKPYDSVEFFISNLIYKPGDEAFTIHEWDNYKRWVTQKESLTRLIITDLSDLDIDADLFDDHMPNLLHKIISEKIIPQTAVAINEVIPFFNDWKNRQIFGFSDTVLKLSKLKRFCKYNIEQVQSKIFEMTSEKI